MTEAKLEEPRSKRAKVEEGSVGKEQQSGLSRDDIARQSLSGQFFQDLEKHRMDYSASEPYLHCVVEDLFDRDFLLKVQKEIVSHLHFKEKVTDIYQVHQTGDLANLEALTEKESEALPTLVKLRKALCSDSFREALRHITGCGPLSASKMDMSINAYRQGNHLLNHDDVIGTRRISFILYLPLPSLSKLGGGEKGWRPEWGGALELYPLADDGINPANIPSKSIPPAFNQFAFFEVQPGHSFHSVEEVVVRSVPGSTGERLSISGWFHRPVQGEPGFDEDAKLVSETSNKTSTLQSLSSDVNDPFQPCLVDATSGLALDETEIKFLNKFFQEKYLTASSISKLAEDFAEASHLTIEDLLRPDVADKISHWLREQDRADKFGAKVRTGQNPPQCHTIPPHHAGHGSDNKAWKLVGPPHIRRYCVLEPCHEGSEGRSLLLGLSSDLCSSAAFQKWLQSITSLRLASQRSSVRRFRPGLDYSLAQSADDVTRLDVLLSFGIPESTRALEASKDAERDLGGWDCFMAPHEGDEDPAVYTSTKDEDEEDTGPLLTIHPQFGSFSITMRDAGVLKFTKYLKSQVDGSLTDISAEFNVADDEA